MLRQLRRLSRTIHTGGRQMSVPAVYAERRGLDWQLEQAAETGYEGVACVDDTARLAVLLLHAYERHRLGWALSWAELNLEFLAHMQQPEGTLANFVLDWGGEPNLTGPTSRPGGLAWLTRAMWAWSLAYRLTGNEEYGRRYHHALDALGSHVDHMDVLALAALSALEMRKVAPDRKLDSLIETWCETILSCRRDGVLLNHSQEVAPHLWAFVQPGALCQASLALRRPEWVPPAQETAHKYLAPIVRDAFAFARVLPYEVSASVFNLEQLHLITGDPEYGELAGFAREWFHGRNTAAAPVYDATLGAVFDGTDDDRMSLNSGAESNIEGGLALLNELPWQEYELK